MQFSTHPETAADNITLGRGRCKEIYSGLLAWKGRAGELGLAVRIRQEGSNAKAGMRRLPLCCQPVGFQDFNNATRELRGTLGSRSYVNHKEGADCHRTVPNLSCVEHNQSQGGVQSKIQMASLSLLSSAQ